MKRWLSYYYCIEESRDIKNVAHVLRIISLRYFIPYFFLLSLLVFLFFSFPFYNSYNANRPENRTEEETDESLSIPLAITDIISAREREGASTSSTWRKSGEGRKGAVSRS